MRSFGIWGGGWFFFADGALIVFYSLAAARAYMTRPDSPTGKIFEIDEEGLPKGDPL